MGVYTYVEKTLGLKVGSSLRKIREKFVKEGTIDPKDFRYLMNMAARYDTFENRMKDKSYVVTEEYSDAKYEINDLVGNLISELNNVYYMHLNEKDEYHVNLSRTIMIGGSRLSIDDLMREIDSGYSEVRLLQENFDANGDDITVVGTFETLLKDYRLDVSVTADMNKEELKTKIRGMVKERLEEEVAGLQQNIALLSK